MQLETSYELEAVRFWAPLFCSPTLKPKLEECTRLEAVVLGLHTLQIYADYFFDDKAQMQLKH